MASSAGASVAPVEDTIRRKITESFEPTRLEIYNDSHLHKHHKAMADSTSAETHFRLVITSAKFQGTPQIRRHRMINEVLKEDLAREGGIHALQLKTMTPEEEKRMEANSTT
ncbi:BolA domain UV induced protein Uvi31 [Gnomoniopsis sp. IMI 355080]|nr:BolA domain UV induced protein Uvi31 [Gnomoniopsis sp. IMI 355080]